MKYFLFGVLSFVLSSSLVHSQILTPEFEFDLYVENDLGYQDRVTIGYDERSTENFNDTLFEEYNIDTLLIQGELEARLYKSFNAQSKRQIIDKYRLNHLYDSTLSVVFAKLDLQIYSNNSPYVTISWDSTLFDISNPANNPHDNSVFVNDPFYISYPEPQYSGAYYEHFLRDHSSLTFDTRSSLFPQYSMETELHQFDTVTHVRIIISNFSMWELDSIRNIVGVSEQDARELTIYPTVTTDKIYIESSYSIDQFVLIDLNGRYRQLGQQPIQAGEIKELDLSHLPPGSYSLLFFTEGGEVRSRRFTKH